MGLPDGLTGPHGDATPGRRDLHWRRRLLSLPTWVWTVSVVVGTGAWTALVLLVLGDLTATTTALLVAAAVALAVLLTADEPRARSRRARAVGWDGDPVELARAGADVDSGRVPQETPQRRELARRHARDRLEQSPLGTIALGLGAVASVSALWEQDGVSRAIAALTLLPVLASLAGGTTGRRRCRRVLQELGADEQAWAARHGTVAPTRPVPPPT